MATLKQSKTLRFWIPLSTTELSYKVKCEKVELDRKPASQGARIWPLELGTLDFFLCFRLAL